LRIIVSGLLFFFIDEPVLFIILYLFCGASDVLDGYLARKLKVESHIGALLDSLGDFIMYMLIIYVLIVRTTFFSNPIVLSLIMAIIALKAVNLIITKMKFNQWGSVHTIAYKITGALVYFLMPLYYLYPHAPLWLIYTLCGLAILSTLEEFLIILTSKQYNVNQKSLARKH